MRVFLGCSSRYRPTAHKPSRPYLPKNVVNLQVTSDNKANSEFATQRFENDNENMNSRQSPFSHRPQLTPAATATINPQISRLEILLVTLVIGTVLVLLPACALWLCIAFDRRRRRRGLRHSYHPSGYHHGLDGATDAPPLSWADKKPLLPLALDEDISGWAPPLPRSRRTGRFGSIDAAATAAAVVAVADRAGVVLSSLRQVVVAVWSGLVGMGSQVATSLSSLRRDVESGHAEDDGEVYPSSGREILGVEKERVLRKRECWYPCSLQRGEEEREGGRGEGMV
ncbi:hypothetical protein MFIFM68171_10350 [Madurella fahalii]|uniref:Transmembrane protein n=1 Tax=Madurella fahalii TaxID=1157608 RepID=A0ABQ0GQY4_9PEZI